MSNIRTNGYKEQFWDILTGRGVERDSMKCRTFSSGHFPLFDSRGEYLGMVIRKTPEWTPLFKGEFWPGGVPK